MVDAARDGLGVITDVWSEESLRQAAALACTVRDHNRLPIVLFATMELKAAVAPYRSMFDDVVFVCEFRDHSLRFSKKLQFLLGSPFAKTLWLDNDILLYGSLDRLLDRLATSPLSMLVYYVPVDTDYAKTLPGYPIACRYGRTDVIERGGGGNLYFARGVESINLMHEVLYFSTPDGIGEFNRELGTKNAEFSEELALCLVAMRNGIALPSRMVPSEVQFHCYIEPNASELTFEEGRCRFQKNPSGGKSILVDQPAIVHFCGNGKKHPSYKAEIDRILQRKPIESAQALAS